MQMTGARQLHTKTENNRKITTNQRIEWYIASNDSTETQIQKEKQKWIMIPQNKI